MWVNHDMGGFLWTLQCYAKSDMINNMILVLRGISEMLYSLIPSCSH